MASVILPDDVWGLLATVADDRDTTVSDLLVAAVAQIVKPRDRRERVLLLVRAGFTDALTAERTGELRQYVGSIRRGAGLPANRQKRSETA